MWIILGIAVGAVLIIFVGKKAHKHRKHKKIIKVEGDRFRWSPERRAREAKHMARRHK